MRTHINHDPPYLIVQHQWAKMIVLLTTKVATYSTLRIMTLNCTVIHLLQSISCQIWHKRIRVIGQLFHSSIFRKSPLTAPYLVLFYRILDVMTIKIYKSTIFAGCHFQYCQYFVIFLAGFLVHFRDQVHRRQIFWIIKLLMPFYFEYKHPTPPSRPFILALICLLR